MTASTDAATKTKVEVKQDEGSAEATVVTSDADYPDNKSSETVDTESTEPTAE